MVNLPASNKRAILESPKDVVEMPLSMMGVGAVLRIKVGSQKWGWFSVAFQLLVGYVLALNAFQIGSLVVTGSFGVWTVITILVDLFALWMILRPSRRVD